MNVWIWAALHASMTVEVVLGERGSSEEPYRMLAVMLASKRAGVCETILM